MNEKIAKRNIKIQTWINFLSGVVFLLPIISIYYKYTGLSIAQIVIISNVNTFAIWLFELPTSVFADTTGRKKSLIASAVCGFLSALLILVFPTFWGFATAALFAALYWSFWSGTGQAFLEENLRILGRQHEFGKVIGNLMFLESLAALTTPLIASLILKTFVNSGYTILAALDVFMALILVFLVMELSETTEIKASLKDFRHLWSENLHTAKSALKNVFGSTKMLLFLVYRSLSHHTLFFPIIVLPLLASKGMLDWYSGILVALATIASMITSKYAYKVGEKFSYEVNWVLGTTVQGVLLILAGLLTSSWILVGLIYVLFNLFDGLWQPAWNHVLVELTKGKAIATTRSVIFSVFALYMTIGKQVLSFLSVETALIGLGSFIILVNLILGKRILKLSSNR
jgi:MFS family permease